MKYPVFYSSSTGNTGLLAKALSDHLEGTLISTEEALSKAPSKTVDSLPHVVFVGFWTDKGTNFAMIKMLPEIFSEAFLAEGMHLFMPGLSDRKGKL